MQEGFCVLFLGLFPSLLTARGYAGSHASQRSTSHRPRTPMDSLHQAALELLPNLLELETCAQHALRPKTEKVDNKQNATNNHCSNLAQGATAVLMVHIF